MIDFVTYIDTDSCVGSSLLWVNNENISIEDYYNLTPEKNFVYEDNSNGHYVKEINNSDESLSMNLFTKQIENKKIKYVMKHKVKKRMFKICWNNNEVEITEDHSIIIERNDKIFDISPKNIHKRDKIFGITDVFFGIETSDFTLEDLGEKEEWVYDIEVDDNHNFFANNILIHNSLYINIEPFILQNIDDKDKWLKLSDDKKVEFIKKLSKSVENYVNDKVQNITQKEIYNSTEKDFKITFEQEKIAKTGLFIKKKKYATHTIIEDGLPKDKISITGLEIIRSDTPLIFKEGLNKILEMILKNHSDDEIIGVMDEYIKKAKKLPIRELSSNIGVNQMDKYILSDLSCKKGTPWHVKGAANYMKMLKMLKIEDKYPEIEEGIKARVVYVKNNPYGIESITYQKWPNEFDEHGIIPDRDVMIDKFFKNKISYLLSPMGKEKIVNHNNKTLDLFFG